MEPFQLCNLVSNAGIYFQASGLKELCLLNNFHAARRGCPDAPCLYFRLALQARKFSFSIRINIKGQYAVLKLGKFFLELLGIILKLQLLGQIVSLALKVSVIGKYPCKVYQVPVKLFHSLIKLALACQ